MSLSLNVLFSLEFNYNSEYSVYQISFYQGLAGLPICIISEPPEQFNPIQPISSYGRLGQLKYLYSPGYPMLYVTWCNNDYCKHISNLIDTNEECRLQNTLVEAKQSCS